ncbi:methyltransferase domain-containing protein [Vallitalea pronyensis]|uniref:Methyltransferase domain-containing protein n=1 Tax=Vallitalea pronyensis TaxID=1348613 RepID=A0A8J8SH59_9FIRM|nr:class I SAM-dependent methyltransferase [Vallitalea pronyensis]QUI23023.1 methyltransferase domain-containing protein [Vallitalea pronyensis]
MDTIKTNIQKSYNNAKAYRKDSLISEWKEKEVKKVLNQIDKNAYMLDLGAGSGVMAKYFDEAGIAITCVDLSKSMVELCCQQGLDAHVMDFYDLAFDEHTFDCVWSMNTLLHVPKSDIATVLKQVKRVLKKDGIFYLGVYGGKSSEGIYQDDFYEPKRFFAFYTLDELLERLKVQFEVIACEEIVLEQKLNYLSFMLKQR